MSVKLVLPLYTTVNVTAVTNAGWKQRVTITPDLGKPLVWEGDGNHDHELGQTTILTPNYSHTRGGYGVIVTIEYLPAGTQNWQESQVYVQQEGVSHYPHLIVRAEDGYDKDWSDTLVKFSWWHP